MACEQCGFQNRGGTRFCVECGTALALRCPSCSAEYQVGQKFCGECGTPLAGAPTAAPAASAPNAVRKTVTVLFADLGGSTGFGERADAEISRQVLARYHALLQETIDAHEGTVAKFMGDGMMATFGIPEVAEDDARRAVAAGADIQHRFEGFAADVERRHGETLTLRVGINTGEVVIGAGDADLIGDALNVAARLEKACRPGQVLVGEETWRLTRAEVAYEALGEVTVAGRAQPVAIYEVVADADAEPEVAAPFVGRDAEMERLVGVFDEARSEARARLVTVLGSPGVGKTRLSRELCARLAEHGDAASVELRCDRAGEATFAPVAQLIREASGVTDDHDPDAARAAIGTLLPPADADHKRVVDVLAGLVGVGPARSVEETFWGVRRLVEATAADRPLVIVIDDIQWAEPLLLDLIEHLAEWVADAAVLVVGLARPELREVRPSLAEPGRPVAAVVVLDGLDASATEALAAGLLGASRLPAGLVDRLPESTDGNPLFVRELVRMLVDDRVIRRRDDGEWELTIDAEAVDVPPTIQSLLGARVERLPAPEREVLEYASVVGAEFSLGALRELAGARVALVSLLESMRRKEMVEPTGTYLGDEPVYRFHHVLIRDAAYRRLLKTTRAELHERVAVWTDRTAADLVGEHEAATAFHYEQAHRYLAELGALGEHGDELGRRAAELLTTAAQRALGRDDLASAGALSARALALLPDSDVTGRSDLLQMGCECLLASGDGAAAKPLVEELGRSAAADPRLAAWAECFAAQLVGLTDPDGLVAADAQAQAAAEALIELGDGSGQAKAHQVRAGLLARLGRVGDAELELDLALAAARAADDRRRVTAVLGAAPDAALFGPSPVARAGGRCLDVVRLLRITTASPAVEAASNRCQAVLESLRGRFDVSRSMLASARTALEELGLRHGIAQTELYAGMVEMIAGNPHAAIAPLRAAYAGLGTLGVGADAGQAAALLAIALLAEGDVDEAELMAAESEALAGQNLKTAIGWRVARAEVLAARGDLTAAVELAEEAVAIAAGTDLVIDHADACVALASLRDRAGDAAGARAARADAKRLYQQKGATVPAERLDQAEVVVAEPEPVVANPPAAVATTNRATELLSHLRAAVNEGLVSDGGDEALIARLVSPDYALEDRRSIVSVTGIDENLEDMGAAIAQGYVVLEPEVIAVRGERLCLCRVVHRTAADDENVRLSVNEFDADDRHLRTVIFDADAFADAAAELDAWYLAGEGAEHADVVTANSAFVRALNDFDFDAMRRLAGPGFVYVDHRQLGTPPLDIDGFIEWQEGYRDVKYQMTVVDLQIRGRVDLVTAVNRAVDASGGEVLWPFVMVGVVDADGRAVRVEAFAVEDRDAALARFDELSGGRPAPSIENAATRAFDQVVALATGRRFDEFGSVVAGDFERIDRRTGVSADPVHGPEAWATAFRSTIESGMDRLAVENLAIRGERLALDRLMFTSDAGDEIPMLAVVEVDGPGLLSFISWHDANSLDAAVAELDARYIAGEGHAALAGLDELNGEGGRLATGNVTTRLAAQVIDELLNRRYERMRELLADDFVREDRRRGVSAPFANGPDEWIAHSAANFDVGFDGIDFRPVAERGEHLALFRIAWTSTDGRLVPFLSVFESDGVGRLQRLAHFDESDTAGALAYFEERDAARNRFAERLSAGRFEETRELSAEAARSRPPTVENLATSVHGRVIAAIADHDDRTLGDLVASEFVHDDRRSVVNMGHADLRGAQRSLRELRAQGFGWRPPMPVAVRGNRLAISRSVFVTDAGDDNSSLAVIEIDTRDRLLSITQFDHDALDVAVAELDARYAAGEGAEHADILRALSASTSASNAKDWDALRSLCREDFVFVDHSPIGWPQLDLDGYIAIQQSYVDEVRVASLTRSVQVRGRTSLGTAASFGVGADGGEFTWVHHGVSSFDESHRCARTEVYAEDDWDAALARFDELSAEDPRTMRAENAASRTSQRVVDLTAAGRYDEATALFRPDFERFDRRHTVAGQTITSATEYMDSFQAILDQFDEITIEPVAVRGDRLHLSRTRFSTESGFETVFWHIAEIDDTGLIYWIASHDEDDLAAALAELDERHLAGEGADHTDILRTSAELVRRHAARDWAGLRELIHPDTVLVDHRRLGWPAGDRDVIVGMWRELVELAPDHHMIVRTQHVAGRAVLTTVDSLGTSDDGGSVAWALHSLAIVDPAGRITTLEFFDEGDWDAALARFDELAAEPVDPRTPRVENAITRRRRAEWEPLIRNGRFDEARARMGEIASDELQRIDRRRTVAAPDADFSGVTDSLEAMYELGLVEVAADPIAVRGERLALYRQVFRSAGGDELVILTLQENDATDRAVFLANYDETQVTEALAELDERFAAGEGAEHADLLSTYTQSLRALQAGDLETMAALASPDFDYVDHRPTSFGALDTGAVLEMAASYLDVARTSVVQKVFFGGRCLIVRLWTRGVTTDGVEAEWLSYNVWLADDAGRALHGELFAEDDWDAALARFDELSAALPSEARTLEIENDATRAARLSWRLLAEGRFDEPPPVAPGFSLESRRRFVRPSEHEDWRDALLLLVEQYSSFVVEPLAVRGSRNAVVRVVAGDEAGNESAWIATLQLDESDRLAWQVNFDEEDEVAAIDLLDEWYIEDEGAADSEILAAHREGMARYHAKDWSGIRAMAAPDFEFVDHRPLPWPMTDIDGLLLLMQERVEQAPDFRSRARKLFVHGRAILSVGDVVGTDEHGGLQQWSVLTVYEIDAAGANRRIEYFAPEQWEAALARFDEVAPGPRDLRTPEVVNRSSRMVEQLWKAAIEQRYDEVATMLAPELVRTDHRSGGIASAPVIGADSYLELLRVSSRPDEVQEVELVPLAVRGERLSLCRCRVKVLDLEILVLMVTELDDVGRVGGVALFDGEDLAAAVDDLDDRFLAGELAPDAQVSSVVRSAWLALRDGDTDAIGRLLSPGLVTVDHQRIGFGTGDREAFLDMEGVNRELFRRDREYVRKGFVSGDAVLVVYESRRLDQHGGELLYESVVVTRVDASDRVDRMEWFDVDDWDAALARFDELAAETPPELRHPRVENAATRVSDECARLVLANRLDEAERLFADGYVRIDRRAGVAAPDAHGGRAFVEAYRGFFDVGFDQVGLEYLAVRGDRFHLVRTRFETADGREVEFLQVAEFDEAGRASAGVNFDVDDLVEALAELDARYVASGAATEAEAALLAGAAALNRRDYEALTALLSPGFVSVDHSPLGFPPADRDVFVQEFMAGLDAMVSDNVRIIVKLFAAGDTVLFVNRVVGTTMDGGEYEWAPVYVTHRGPEGLIDRVDSFQPENWDVALARFDELAAAEPRDDRSLELENAATRDVGRIGLHLAVTGRFDEYRALLRPDVERVDRRRTVSAPPAQGIDAYMDALQWLAQFDSDRIEPLAVRGDRAAAYRVFVSDEGGNEVAMIVAVLVDETARLVRQVNFDDDADGEIDAIDQIDEWYAEGEGVADSLGLSHHRDGMRRYHARDWDAMRAATTDDFELVDHRPLGWPLADADGWIRLMQERVAQVPDMRCAVRKVWARHGVGLSLIEVMGTDPDGGRFSWPSLQVSGPLSADGRNPRIEYFPVDDVDAAFARFDELAAAAPEPAAGPVLDNAAMRYLQAAQVFSSTPGRDVDEFSVRWLAEDVVRVDRRTGVSAPEVSGREAYADVFRAMREAFVDFTLDPVTIRGDRLALVATVGTSPEGFELPYLILVEVDDAGRAQFLAHFDEDDLAGAFGELDDRFQAGEGADHAQTLARHGDFGRAYAARDWTAVAALFAEDAVVTDHRAIGQGWSNGDDFVASSRMVVELVPDVVHVARELEVRNSVILTNAEAFGTTGDGNRYSWSYRMVVAYEAGLIVRLELFDADDEESAQARFEELADVDPRTPTIDNDAVRQTERLMWLARFDFDRSPEMFSPDVAYTDHRAVVALPTLNGIEAMATVYTSVFEVYDDVVMEPTAVRGERLALYTLRMSTSGGAESGAHLLVGLDERGRIDLMVGFDEDDLLRAVEELDRRHHDVCGDAYPLAEAVYTRNALAASRGDYEPMAASHAADYVSVDHRLVGMGETDSAGQVEQTELMAAQLPGLVLCPARLYSSTRAVLTYMPIRGTTEDGSEYVWELAVVEIVDDAGQIVADHNFQIEQWDEALALFDEWSQQAESPEVALPPVENAAVRKMDNPSDLTAARAELERPGD